MSKYNKLLLVSILVLSFIAIKSISIDAKENNNKTYNDIKREENIVFLGDSITDWYPIDEVFGDLPIVRSGIAGFETKDILKDMNKMVYQYNPTKVIILIGTNDLKYKESTTEETIENTKTIIENIKKNRKNTKIYYQSIYPVNRNMWAVENRYNEEIQEVNEKMKEYCRDNDVTYIDMYNELSDEEGNFREDFTDDGLHPNSLAYGRISQVLLRYIYGDE